MRAYASPGHEAHDIHQGFTHFYAPAKLDEGARRDTVDGPVNPPTLLIRQCSGLQSMSRAYAQVKLCLDYELGQSPLVGVGVREGSPLQLSIVWDVLGIYLGEMNAF